MQSNLASATTPTPAADESGRAVVAHLRQSEIYRNYQQAYETTTGLPLDIRAAGSFQSPLHGSKHANSFCVLMAKANKTCAACLQLQQRVEQDATAEAKTLQCFAGLSESAVPIRVGEKVLGYLQTGQIFLQAPTKTGFRRVLAQLAKWGSTANVRELETAYFKTRVLAKHHYLSAVSLLSVFAQHLSALSNQVMVQEAAAESPLITRARALIAERQTDALSLVEVARSVHVSAFYFCKLFKQSTGLTFTDYLARVRVESVKTMLLNPHLRVSEAAYAAGFQSLSQFNRVFRRIEGESPTVYRDHRHGAAAHHSFRPVGRAA
ncbi:MAG: helix-turn-helix domain-containing protein [Opitutae bacterium]|nr:helix-turn-helix domain-containing protein [Opitutae bacterium]